MAKHLIDTDLYIDLIQSGATLPLIRELYAQDTPGIYFSSIVAEELLAGRAQQSGKGRLKRYFGHSRESAALSLSDIAIGKTLASSSRKFYNRGLASRASCRLW